MWSRGGCNAGVPAPGVGGRGSERGSKTARQALSAAQGPADGTPEDPACGLAAGNSPTEAT